MTQSVYQVTRNEGFARDFALCNQIRRAATPITSNIAEGFQHGRRREFVQFLRYAKASAGEVRSQLYVAFDEGYVDEPTFTALREDARSTSRQIQGFIRYLEGVGD